MDEFLILLQAKLDEAKSKGNVNADIKELQNQLDKLKIQAEIDPKTLSNFAKQLEGVLNQKIVISDIGINQNNITKTAQQTGKEIGSAINQGISSAAKSTGKILRDFSELNNAKRQFVDGHDLISKNDISDAERFYDTVRKAFSEFGQVTINKGEINDGTLDSLRVKIEQVNDEAKITRDFMLYLNQVDDFGNTFKLADDDTIRSTEKMIQHLNEEKNIVNATNEEANAIKEKLAEQEKYYGKLEQASKEQLAIEKQRITAGEKQLEILDAQSKRRDSRISYNEKQIDKKGLSDISKQRKINDLSYSGREKVDASFAKEIDKNLASLSKLKTEWKKQGIYIDEFKAKVDNLEKSLNEISIGDVKGLNTLKNQLSSLSTEAKELSQIHEIQLSIDNGTYDKQLSSLVASYERLGLTSDEVKTKTNDVSIALDKLKEKNFSTLESDVKHFANELKKSQNEATILKNDLENIYNPKKQARLSTDIQNWLSKNSRASKEAKESLNAYYRELSDGRVSVDRLNYIEQELKSIDATQRGLGKLGKNLKDQFKEASASFTQWLSVSSGIMALVYQLQKMPKEVIKVNSAMVELNKVSEASAADIIKYFDEAVKSAKRYGSSVSDLISATADWSRLGYSLPDSKKLAEVATLYKNVGDGIDIATANESLVSTLQGFKLNADDAMHIIDAFNEVGNNFAIGSDGIGEALKRSASSMFAAGNTLEETIGLVTAANAVVQDPDSIGTAYKTISMRIRGAKTEMEELGLETDGMVESTATLQKEILALSGVDIMKDKDTFKSTYQILDELATKWQDLTDIQQASITELIAGKRQGNIVSALMSNFETARQATETAINSTGSALKEQEAYEQGIQYSLDRLEASFQAFANHILDSDFLKGIIDFGNGTINVIDAVTSKLGSLGTIGLGAGLFSSIKNVGMAELY